MGKHIAMLENMKPDDKEQDEYNRERDMYTRIEREESIQHRKNRQSEEELSDTSDEEGIASKKDMKHIDFSPSFGVSISGKVKLKEDINIFNTDIPATSIKDFTQDFSIDCPISKILKKLKNISEKKSVKRTYPTDPIQEAIHANKWWKKGFITKKYCWSKLEHGGVSINQYKPHGIPLKYGDTDIQLTADQEEFVNAVAPTWQLETKSHKERWLQLFREYFGETEMTDISKINMNRIHAHLIQESLKQTKNKPQYAIVDGSVVPVDVGDFSSKIAFLSKKVEYYSRVIPENITLAADLESPVPPCLMDGHNWEQLNFSPTNAYAAFATISQKTRFPFSPSSKFYQDYVNFTNIRNMGSVVVRMQQYVKNHIQAEDLKKREKATLLWLQLFYFLEVANKSSVPELKVKNIRFKSAHIIEIKVSSTLVIAIHDTQFPYADSVFKNLTDFCRDKKEDEQVFTVSRVEYNQLMSNYFPSFSLTNYVSFIASIHLNKFLKESLPSSLTTSQKKLLFESTRYYVAEKLISRKWDKKHSIYAMAEEYVLVTQQLHELKRMLKKVKKGESISLLTQKDKMIMEEIIQLPEEDALRKAYDRLKEKKRKAMSFEEWKKKEIESVEEKRKKQKEVRNKCAILFEEMPSVKEVKERVEEYKGKLEQIDNEIRGYSNGGRVTIDFDPRIVVAWCKRVDCPIDSVMPASTQLTIKWALDTAEDFEYSCVF